MENQKMENLLNLALAAGRQDLEQSESLRTGYDPQQRTWEVIVKYTGSLDPLREQGIGVYELLHQFAVLTVPEALVEWMSLLPQIEYVEKPKRLLFAADQARAASCIDLVQTEERGGGPYLTGRGVICAVIDSGIDYFHDDFRNPDGTTRILELWDQSMDRVFTREEIDWALEAGSRTAARERVPSADGSGHGTAAAGLMAGNGRESGGRYRGPAFESDLLVVKMGTADPLGFPRTTELMKGLDYAAQFAAGRQQPLAVNISFGNTYGSHSGTGLLGAYIDSVSRFGRSSIVIGTGNEGAAAGHAAGVLKDREEKRELSVSPYETSLSVQLWKRYGDEFQIRLTAPSGRVLGPLPPVPGPQVLESGNTRILLYYGEPGPFSSAQEIYFEFLPARGAYLDSGLWTFSLTPEHILDGRFDFWLPAASGLNRSTGFLKPSPELTLTVPSDTALAVSVGAYDSRRRTYADFSGRGFTRLTGQIKPDLAAPGVGLTAPKSGGGYETVTGTSFASPIAAGAAALLMQWGIVDGNDPFLYGEKVRAYLIRGARRLPGFDRWPNPQMGWGALCLRDSLPLP